MSNNTARGCHDCKHVHTPITESPCLTCSITSHWEPIDRQETQTAPAKNDLVNHPAHYTSSGGIECIDALESMVQGYTNVQDGSEAWQVVKYVWRAPLKGRPLEDLKKARWYLERIIGRLERAGQTN